MAVAKRAGRALLGWSGIVAGPLAAGLVLAPVASAQPVSAAVVHSIPAGLPAAPAAAATLVVHFDAFPSGTRSGTTVPVTVWVAATGAIAHNAKVALSAVPGASLAATCTRSAGRCALGDLDSRGVSIPLSVTVPARTAITRLRLSARATADGVAPVQTSGLLVLAPAPRPTPSTPRGTSSHPPASPPPAPSSPSASSSGTTPPSGAGVPSSSASPVPEAPSPSSTPGVALPTIAPAPSPSANAATPPVLAKSRLRGRRPVASAGLVGGASVWMAVLLAGVVALAAWPRRRRRGSGAALLPAAGAVRPAGDTAVGSASPGDESAPGRQIDLAIFLRFTGSRHGGEEQHRTRSWKFVKVNRP
ncbi:hypothetical protein [Actinomadura rupiterrae]|uniref:hypothetical protein n=1 Tax=Actinomadura rupiterrae TaxID=559627 RepID=UPI0020A529CA|nr:hypothetical protein [Actinomadura rupiterrae]MCP2338871.1 hypothetical protein [Actinomadura rupiterrae]